MAKTGKIWEAIIWTIVIAILLNGVFFYLSLNANDRTIAAIATILTPVISAINYIIMGFAAGLGFYLAKQKIEK